MPKPKRTKHFGSFEEFQKKHGEATRKKVKDRVTKVIPKPKAKPKRALPKKKLTPPEALAEKMKTHPGYTFAVKPSITRKQGSKTRAQLYEEIKDEFFEWMGKFHDKPLKGKARIQALKEGVEIYGRTDRWHDYRANRLGDFRKMKLPEIQARAKQELSEIAARNKKGYEAIPAQVEDFVKAQFYNFILESIAKGGFPSTYHFFTNFVDKHFLTKAPPAFK